MSRFDEIALRECGRLEEYYRRVGNAYGLARFVYDSCMSDMSSSDGFNVVVNGEGKERHLQGTIDVRGRRDGNLLVFTVSNQRGTNRFSVRFGTDDIVLTIEAAGDIAGARRTLPSEASDDDVVDIVLEIVVELAFRNVQKPSAYQKKAPRTR